MLLASCSFAQWPFAQPTTPGAQRNALNGLRSQINWFQNATSTATSYGEQGYAKVWEQFQGLRDAYNGLKQTLNANQQAYGANELADLDAGLEIIQEAFTNFQNDVNAGRNVNMAMRDMCQVLRRASQVWAQQLSKVCSHLRVGIG